MPVLNEAKKVYLGSTLIYSQRPTGKGVWKLTAGQTVPTQVTGITWNSTNQCFEKTISNNIYDQIYVTTDGQTPLADATNVCLFFTCTQVSGTFTCISGCYYTDGTHEGPIYLTV